MVLTGGGFGHHIPKGYACFAMVFSVFLEMVNIRGVSVVTSMVVMRGQGLGFAAIAVMTLGPLALLELASRPRPGPWRWQPGFGA
jgi:hypothetical protein